MSHILEDNFDSIGYQVQATMYFCSMAGSSIAPAFVNKFGLKTMLILGGITFTMVVISQILPSEYSYYQQNPDPDALSMFTNKTFIQATLIISAVISGFGAAAIWVS